MLASLGFYFIFIFKIILGGVLSLIIGYLNRENEDSESLKSYFMLSLITISLVSILDNYASNNSNQILAFLIQEHLIDFEFYLFQLISLLNHPSLYLLFLQLMQINRPRKEVLQYMYLI